MGAAVVSVRRVGGGRDCVGVSPLRHRRPLTCPSQGGCITLACVRWAVAHGHTPCGCLAIPWTRRSHTQHLRHRSPPRRTHRPPPHPHHACCFFRFGLRSVQWQSTGQCTRRAGEGQTRCTVGGARMQVVAAAAPVRDGLLMPDATDGVVRVIVVHGSLPQRQQVAGRALGQHGARPHAVRLERSAQLAPPTVGVLLLPTTRTGTRPSCGPTLGLALGCNPSYPDV